MSDEFKIQLEIAGKTYPYICERNHHEELFARRAAKQINDKMLQYRRSFSGPEIGISDLLAMVAFQLSLSDVKLVEDKSMSPLFEKLEELSQELENYLGTEE